MRVLGVDIGIKRTGLAISDETGISVRLLPNLVAHSRTAAIEKLLSLINEFDIKTIVIGCPQPKTSGSQAIFSRANGLKKALDEQILSLNLAVTVVLWDESLTSKKAAKILALSAVPQKKRKALLDSASASIIVEDYLASIR